MVLGKHFCQFCSFSSPELAGLKIHLKTHESTEPWNCEYCTYSTTHKASYNKHMNNHGVSCPLCDYIAFDKADRERHCASHLVESNTCEVTLDVSTTAVKGSKGLTKMVASRKTVPSNFLPGDSDGESGQCPYCAFTTPDDKILKRHIIKHRTTRIERTFTVVNTKPKPSPINHNRNAAANITKVSANALTLPLSFNPTGDVYSCHVCVFECNYRIDLNRHMMTHAAKKLKHSEYAAPRKVKPTVACGGGGATASGTTVKTRNATATTATTGNTGTSIDAGTRTGSADSSAATQATTAVAAGMLQDTATSSNSSCATSSDGDEGSGDCEGSGDAEGSSEDSDYNDNDDGNDAGNDDGNDDGNDAGNDDGNDAGNDACNDAGNDAGCINNRTKRTRTTTANSSSLCVVGDNKDDVLGNKRSRQGRGGLQEGDKADVAENEEEEVTQSIGTVQRKKRKVRNRQNMDDYVY